MAKANEKDAGITYEVSASYKKKDVLTVIDKEHVNLSGGDHEVKTKGDKNNPPKTYTYKAATQEQRKKYYERAILKNPDGSPQLDSNGEPISKQPVIIKKVSGNTTSNPSE